MVAQAGGSGRQLSMLSMLYFTSLGASNFGHVSFVGLTNCLYDKELVLLRDILWSGESGGVGSFGFIGFGYLLVMCL